MGSKVHMTQEEEKAVIPTLTEGLEGFWVADNIRPWGRIMNDMVLKGVAMGLSHVP